MLKKKLVSIMAIFLALSVFSCSGVKAENKAPDFTLPDLEGEPYSLSDSAGKVIIVDFWATWCPPCRMEVPHFQELYEEYGRSGLEIVGIAMDRGGAEAVTPFVDSNNVTYKVVIGDKSTADAYGGIRGIPTTFIVDRKGNITDKFVGYRSKEIFEEAIKKLL